VNNEARLYLQVHKYTHLVHFFTCTNLLFFSVKQADTEAALERAKRLELGPDDEDYMEEHLYEHEEEDEEKMEKTKDSTGSSSGGIQAIRFGIKKNDSTLSNIATVNVLDLCKLLVIECYLNEFS